MYVARHFPESAARDKLAAIMSSERSQTYLDKSDRGRGNSKISHILPL